VAAGPDGQLQNSLRLNWIYNHMFVLIIAEVVQGKEQGQGEQPGFVR
jgi:hypothetical protein